MLKPERLEKLLTISRNRYQLQITADWRYEQFFNFLQISPSYRLAHEIASGRIDRNAAELAYDFETVEACYQAFGDVWRINFWKWWITKAQYQFGTSAVPTVHQIARVEVGNEPTEEELGKVHEEVDQYLLADRLAEAKPASLLLAVPLHGDRKHILKQFTDILDKAYDPKQHQRGIAAYQVTRNKIRLQTLKDAMRVLRARAALPNKKLFEVGNRSKISAAYETDETKPGFDYDRKRLMEILTSRYLQRAYLVAEHAARGIFPSLDTLPDDKARPVFDYHQLQQQFKDYILWLEAELKRIESLVP